jgi:hypothetical protein
VEGLEGEAVVTEGDGDLSDAAQEQHLAAVALHGLSSLPPLLSSIVYGLIFRSSAACSSGRDACFFSFCWFDFVRVRLGWT